MKTNNIIQLKSYAFAIRIVKVYKYLVDEKKKFILSKQLLRCGTSIGTNIEEATGAQSSRDFFSKLTISYKKSRETKYWIRLLYDSNYLNDVQAKSLLIDIEEILKILGSIQKTLRNS